MQNESFGILFTNYDFPPVPEVGLTLGCRTAAFPRKEVVIESRLRPLRVSPEVRLELIIPDPHELVKAKVGHPWHGSFQRTSCPFRYIFDLWKANCGGGQKTLSSKKESSSGLVQSAGKRLCCQHCSAVGLSLFGKQQVAAQIPRGGSSEQLPVHFCGLETLFSSCQKALPSGRILSVHSSRVKQINPGAVIFSGHE